jgi:L-ascorbate 6-phosphate lactonase
MKYTDDMATRISTAAAGQTHLFSVGQAGYIIKSASGQLLGIDLYLSDCVERAERNMGFKRLLPKLLEPDELELDCVIATHPHYDHFDVDAVPQLMSNQHTQMFASVNCRREVQRLNMRNDRITYVRPGETYAVGDFKMEFVNCDHGTGAPDAVGVVVTVDGKKIYEAGDTCLRLDRVEEYRNKGPFDVMIAPINGAFGNLNERDCAAFSAALTPKLTIPCHYGMFAAHGGDPGLFYRIMKEQYPNNQFLLMTMGEELVL